ncbi:MAG: hypothetical protein ISR75_01810 [Phycisphaerales bacterium]|nr:hypothetical protein [Planctomycetota bacterium]MBL6997160.1 hypothetical protein [Phycisphaerales bacterium]
MQSFATLCSDFYVNQKISLSVDLPKAEELASELFERIRREIPEFERIRPFDGELSLETSEVDGRYKWVGLRPRSISSGSVNPNHIEDSYGLHRLVLELAPYYLSLTPLHVEFVELVYGFDLSARQNRNNVVMQTLLRNSPLASLADESMEPLLDVQPRIGFALNEACDLQAFVEVKTRTSASETATQVFQDEPISVFLTVRKNGPIQAIEELEETFSRLAGHIEHIAEHRVVPDIVVPLHQAIGI